MSQFLFFIQLLYVITIVSVVIVIISDNKNPIKSIAWIVVIALLPVVGLLIYLIFGQDITKKQVISKRMYSKLKKRPLDEMGSDEEQPVAYEKHQRLISLLQNLDHTPLLGGNDLKFLDTGKQKFDTLLADIMAAKNHIHIEYYVFADDALGTRIKQALIQKAKEGLEVRVIYDSFGSRHTRKRFFEEMRMAGIEAEPFLKLAMPIITSRLNFRNHRKLVIIDGQVGYIGGMNIADRYIDGLQWGQWRDLHIRIEGKGVQGLQSIFLIDWYFVSQTLITSRRYFPILENYGPVVLQTVNSGPMKDQSEISHGVLQAIYNAQKSIFIQTPYFLPPEAMAEALQAAAIRGVDVRVMIPTRSDVSIVHLATRSFVEEMLAADVKVYTYNGGFLHSKLMIFDDSLTLVGSVNFDFRSFENNFEVEAFVYDNDTASKAKEIFLTDQRNSTVLSLKEWRKRPVMTRFAESFMRLFAPLL